MSTKPRTPRYFPRMKMRGGRRRHRTPWQGIVAAFNAMAKTIAAVAAAFHRTPLTSYFPAQWVTLGTPTFAQRAIDAEPWHYDHTPPEGDTA